MTEQAPKKAKSPGSAGAAKTKAKPANPAAASADSADKVKPAATASAASPVDQAVAAFTPSFFEKGLTMSTEYERMKEMSTGNVEAVMSAGKIAASGFEDIAREMTNYFKTTVEDSVSASSALLACKDIQEVYDLQTKQAQKFWDLWLTESTKLSEMSYKMVSDSMAPISERVTASVNEFNKPTA